MITFFIPGQPVPQGRPRCRCLRMGRRAVPQIYNAHEADEWKATISIITRQNAPKAPLTGSVRLMATFMLARPATHYRGKAKALRAEAPIWHTGKPDTDNLVKALKDAMTRIMWVDDSQVCDEHVIKIFTNDGKPGCLVSIEVIDPVLEPLHELCLNLSTEVANTTPL